jgi:hypothetical protein
MGDVLAHWAPACGLWDPQLSRGDIIGTAIPELDMASVFHQLTPDWPSITAAGRYFHTTREGLVDRLPTLGLFGFDANKRAAEVVSRSMLKVNQLMAKCCAITHALEESKANPPKHIDYT